MKQFEQDIKDFSIQSVRINYIYSFFLGVHKLTNDKVNSDVNEDDKVILDWNTPISKKNNTLRESIQSDLYKDDVEKSYLKTIVEYHDSEEKEPLSNRSALYFNFPHFSISKKYLPKIKIEKLFNDDKIGKLVIHIALFQTGMGMMWVSVQIDDEKGIPNSEIHKINKRKRMPLIAEEFSPHDYFKNEINDLVTRLNSILNNHSLEYKNEFSFFWKDNNNDYGRGVNISQEPSIAILLKSNNYQDYIERESFQYYISSILHGTNLLDVDKKHAKEHVGEFCTNLFPSKKFFTRIHGNCLFVLHNQDYEDECLDDLLFNYNPFKEFTYGLFRTYCAVRGTWYMYNILSEEIDNNLKALNSKIEDNIEGIDKAQETKNNIILKSHFLQYLNSEDPFVRGIGLTKFAKLYDEVTEIYKPEEIKSSIKYKLREYDKLIDAINSYKYYKITSRNSSASKKSLKSYIIPIIAILIFATLICLRFLFNVIVPEPIFNVGILISSITIFAYLLLKIIIR